jgi:hypothetical protein
MNEQPEFEELEHIPWSALAARTAPPLLRPVAIAVVAVIAVAVLAWLAMRVLAADQADETGPSSAVSAAGPDVPSEPLTVDNGAESVPAADPVSGAEPAGTLVATVDPAMYSEADLMAIAVDDESRLAAMRAEWFVQDYFTVDGDEEIAKDLHNLIAIDEDLPHSSPAGSSYVEWARAVAITSPMPAEYVVEVAFRTVLSTDGEAFTRAPVRAVVVTVTVDVDGSVTIEGLPAPVRLSAVAWRASTRGADAIAPDDVVVAALAEAESFGDNPVVTETRRDGSEWLFVVVVRDASGNRWPLELVLAD